MVDDRRSTESEPSIIFYRVPCRRPQVVVNEGVTKKDEQKVRLLDNKCVVLERYRGVKIASYEYRSMVNGRAVK